MDDNPRAVIGGNNPPSDPKPDRTFKKRWAYALFCRPDKPAGAVAMGFKLYMEMDGQGQGATISDAEFQVSCGVSDGACRTFKRWLVTNGFIRILVRGRRGYRSEFKATIPGEVIPADNAAINSIQEAEYRQTIPANNAEISPTQPATIAAIPVHTAPVHARIEPPSGVVIYNTNSKLASAAPVPERELAGLNGSADPMISDILGWMGSGTEVNARQWLSTFVQTHGQEHVRNSYLKLKTDILSGSLIAKPLQAWSKIAQRMKAEPAQRTGQPENGDAEAAKQAWQRKIIEEALQEKRK